MLKKKQKTWTWTLTNSFSGSYHGETSSGTESEQQQRSQKNSHPMCWIKLNSLLSDKIKISASADDIVESVEIFSSHLDNQYEY